jgi:hypothetical protein
LPKGETRQRQIWVPLTSAMKKEKVAKGGNEAKANMGEIISHYIYKPTHIRGFQCHVTTVAQGLTDFGSACQHALALLSHVTTVAQGLYNCGNACKHALAFLCGSVGYDSRHAIPLHSTQVNWNRMPASVVRHEGPTLLAAQLAPHDSLRYAASCLPVCTVTLPSILWQTV